MYYQMLYKLVLMEEFYLIGHKQQSTHMGIFYGLWSFTQRITLSDGVGSYENLELIMAITIYWAPTMCWEP